MAATNEDVKGTLKIFQSLTDEEVTKAINRANRKAEHDGLTDAALDDGTVDYARHLLFIEHAMSYGPVQSSETFGNQQTNFDKLSGNDPFLIEYNDLVEAFGSGANWGDVWTE